MIGQYGKYDFAKFKRDFRKNFYGTEACLFQSEEDIDSLCVEAAKNGFVIGIHFPLRAGVHKYRDPQFMAADKGVREAAFASIAEELDYIKHKGMKPEYILFHYPKPVILGENTDWSGWRFADPSEYIYESEYSYDEFVKSSGFLFGWLAEKGFEYGFTPVLEFDAIPAYIRNTSILEELLDRHKSIRLCLDTARLHTQDGTEASFDPEDILRRFAKYAEIIHLSNAKVTNRIDHAHFPALPGLSPKDGWANIKTYMDILHQNNPDVKIMFEHRSDLITEGELEACYSWIYGLMKEADASNHFF